MCKDKTKDGETAASSKTNRDHSRDQEARDAALAKTIIEAVTREMAKAHAQYQAIANEKSTPTLPTSLKISSGSHGFKVWTPSIGQRTNLSTRDGNYGHIRLDSPLMPWREIHRKPRFLTSTIGSMEMVLHRLKHGKTTKS